MRSGGTEGENSYTIYYPAAELRDVPGEDAIVARTVQLPDADTLTQEELADRMGYRSKSSITKLEKGVNDLPQSKLEELAAAQPQPEQTETEEEAEDAPEEGENSQTALVMAHVRRYLEDNYMFDLSLDSVGEILHISPAYLSAQFKKYQKMNFLDCLTELRINAAKELLTDPFRSSAEVASMVGYEDASYFARAFKKRTGMTPTQYRRQAGQKAKADPEAGL